MIWSWVTYYSRQGAHFGTAWELRSASALLLWVLCDAGPMISLGGSTWPRVTATLRETAQASQRIHAQIFEPYFSFLDVSWENLFFGVFRN